MLLLTGKTPRVVGGRFSSRNLQIVLVVQIKIDRFYFLVNFDLARPLARLARRAKKVAPFQYFLGKLAPHFGIFYANWAARVCLARAIFI